MLDFAEAYAAHVEATQWISVDERLPEYETEHCSIDVQVCVLGSVLKEAAYFASRNGDWHFCRTSEILKLADKVTHWRPLPQPPTQ